MSVLLSQNRDPLAKARALEAKAAEKSRLAEEAKRQEAEENRRKYPTAAWLKDYLAEFNGGIVEARDGENYVANDKIVRPNEVKIIPFTWTEEMIRQQQREGGKG